MSVTTAAGTPTLDRDQRRVAEAAVDERLFVTAGPGSGKTETVSARLEHLLNSEGLGGNEILVISFSRAAVEAIQRRQRKNGAYSWIWVTTIDSLATRILTEEGEDLTRLGFDDRIKRLSSLLQGDSIGDPLHDVRHVIIDEVQDVVGIRATLVALLLAKLPATTGFTMLGDPKQGIYGFQLDGDHSDPDLILHRARALDATEVGLWGQFRAESRDSVKAMKLRGTGQSDFAWIGEMREFVAEMPPLDVDQLADRLRTAQGSVAVLTQTNAQALAIARELYKRDIAVDLLARAAERSIDPWVAEVLADAPPSVTKDLFLSIASDVAPIDPSAAWALLRGITRANTPYLNLRQVAQRLATGIVPVAITRRRSQVTVSTVHRAKGLEFDEVMLLDPRSWFQEEDDDFARVLYVAITRPRRRLFTFQLNGDDRWWRADKRTERAYLAGFGNRGTKGFEIRGADWRGLEPPDADGDPLRAQNLLKSLASDRLPVPIDIKFVAYESTDSRPTYAAYFAGTRIGTLGGGFVEAFGRRIGQRQKHWPEIAGTFFTGVETVAAPPQTGPVGQNGLWLSPLIVGPATLEWSRS